VSSGLAAVLQVRENSDVGTFVAHLSVVDADSGDNGRFICSVDDRNFALQQIYTSELKLVTSTRLDRERRDEYQLSISCRDFGATPLTSVVPLTVKVGSSSLVLTFSRTAWPRNLTADLRIRSAFSQRFVASLQ